jgi:TM2 domain-containing membrane protein YozV
MEKMRLEELFDEELIFENVPLTIKRRSKNKVLKWVTSEKYVPISIPFIFTGNYGVYVFIEDIEDAQQIYSTLQSKLKLKQGLFVFAEEEEGGSYYDADHSCYIDFEDFYEAIEIFRANHMVPECLRHRVKFINIEDYFEDKSELLALDDEEDGDQYIRPVIGDNKLDEVDNAIDALSDEPTLDGKYIRYPDGTVKVKQFVSQRFGAGAEVLFPCSEVDPNKMFWITVLGGWFGAHKFVDGKWGQGVLYTLTCGMCGIFYMSDLISMLMGSYYFTKVDYSMGHNKRINKSAQRIYMQPLEKKWICALGLIAAVALTMFTINILYKPLLAGITALLSSIANNQVVNNEEIIAGIEGASDVIELIP